MWTKFEYCDCGLGNNGVGLWVEIYIEAAREAAENIFRNRFGPVPNCNIKEYETLPPPHQALYIPADRIQENERD